MSVQVCAQGFCGGERGGHGGRGCFGQCGCGMLLGRWAKVLCGPPLPFLHQAQQSRLHSVLWQILLPIRGCTYCAHEPFPLCPHISLCSLITAKCKGEGRLLIWLNDLPCSPHSAVPIPTTHLHPLTKIMGQILNDSLLYLRYSPNPVGGHAKFSYMALDIPHVFLMQFILVTLCSALYLKSCHILALA